MISVQNGWVLALDNLSTLPPWFSDALCRLSTGGAFRTRALYKDDEEKILTAQRPIIVTGIEELAEKGDLLDRSLSLCLPPIPPHKRKLESELKELETKYRPRILGALLDAVSAAIQRGASFRLPELPRMADFVQWVSSAESALEWTEGKFLRAYKKNQENSNEIPRRPA